MDTAIARQDEEFLEDTTMPERRQGVYQALAQNDEKHDAAHKRLRMDFRELEERLTDAAALLRDRQIENTAKISKLEDALNVVKDTPPNVENVIMTPRVMIGIVLFAVTIAGSIWGSTAGLRSDMRDIKTNSEASAKLQELRFDTLAKAQEIQSNTQAKATQALTSQLQLLQIEFQQFKEQMIERGRTK